MSKRSQDRRKMALLKLDVLQALEEATECLGKLIKGGNVTGEGLREIKAANTAFVEVRDTARRAAK